jgi:hypothetical protein
VIEPGPEFDRLFLEFEHSAYRLESRESYKEASENEVFDRFTAGEVIDMGFLDGWLDLIRSATAAGKRFSRVRVASLPLSDYNRFGLFCSKYANAAGEDIRYLSRDDAVGLPEYDYWLFDSCKLVRLHFGNDEAFAGGELIDDPALIVQHNYWRDAARHRAVLRDDFAIATSSS